MAADGLASNQAGGAPTSKAAISATSWAANARLSTKEEHTAREAGLRQPEMSAIGVMVLPVPVAIVSSIFLPPLSRASSMPSIASVWYGPGSSDQFHYTFVTSSMQY